MESFKKNKNDLKLTIFLYDEPSSKTLDLNKIKKYLNNKLGDIDIEVRRDFISFHLNSRCLEEYSKKFAQIRIKNLSDPQVDPTVPLPGEIMFEKSLIEHPKKNVSGVLYDGYQLDTLFRSLIPREELDFHNIHIVFTNRLFGTFDETDRRYHARVILCGYPSIISTTGIVEAPAKPREFYHMKQKYQLLRGGELLEAIKEKLYGRFIDYNDPRLTEVMKGYVMQSVFYHLTYEPFCMNKNCRLYNAHWQEDVICAQLKNNEFCEKHEQILEIYKNKIKLISNKKRC